MNAGGYGGEHDGRISCPSEPMARLAAKLVHCALLATFAATACGGATEMEPGEGTGGSDSSGGQNAKGGAAKGGAVSTTGGFPGITGGATATTGGFSGTTGGAIGTGGHGQGGSVDCCLAAPVCNAGDKQIPAPTACPTGSSCYSVSVCCSTIWCTTAPQCDAVPTCNPGDQQLMGACPPGRVDCYTRSACGTTIHCRSLGGAGGASGTGGSVGTAGEGGEPGCDPASEYNREYMTTSARLCALIDFTCVAGTTHFQNDCGCGCQQDPSCPRVVDCMPGGAQNSLCTPAGQARCPYTLRAL